MAKKTSIAKKVDGGILNQIQTGCVGDPPPIKEEPAPEELSEKEKAEKAFMQRVLKQLVPEFPIKKLDKMTYVQVSRFFNEEVSPIIQEEILYRFKDISP